MWDLADGGGVAGQAAPHVAVGPTAVPARLDAAALRRFGGGAVDVLAAHRAEIDALNVFPVPDGDTGRNMLLTCRAAADALAAQPAATDAAAALAALATGAARGAIGNSGFLLSQLLRGLAEAARPAVDLDAQDVVEGLRRGAVLARAAVVTPVDGTMLTVADAAADGAAAAVRDGASLADTLCAAVAVADAALQRTPTQLAELEDAGVVDAGGRGLVLVLAALAAGAGADPVTPTAVHSPEPKVRRDAGHGEGADAVDGFEVQYLLDAPESSVRRLRRRLDELGESVAVVGTGPHAWKVHVHVVDVGPAIEAGLEAGRPHDISVVRLGRRPVPGPAPSAGDRGTPASRLVVAVTAGRRLGDLLHREGVLVVPLTGGGTAPVADEVPDECDEVVLLVGEAAMATAEDAAQALRRRGVRTSVVPVRSPVQALAAVAVHDPARGFDDDVVAMAEAAGATRYAELTFAATTALTAVGMCQPGDVLGLIDGDVVEIGHSVLGVAVDVLDRLLGIGAELVTLLVGAEAPPNVAAVLEKHVRHRSPLTDVAVYDAGDLDSPVVIGAE